MRIEIEDNPRKEDIETISESLFRYNCQKVGLNDYRTLTLFLRNEEGTIAGGLIGWTRWDWAHIDGLWIDEKYRRQGHGQEMLRLAETLAKQRGCRMIDLDTFDFQAPRFYLQNGYRELFVLEGFGNGNSRHFMKKELDCDG